MSDEGIALAVLLTVQGGIWLAIGLWMGRLLWGV